MALRATKTSPAVQTFYEQTSALLGPNAARLSGSVQEIDGRPVAQNLRYATPSGTITVLASGTGAPVLQNAQGGQINTYAPSRSVMSMRTHNLLTGHDRLTRILIFWVSRWQKFPFQSALLVLLPLSFALMALLAILGIFLPVPHPFFTAALFWPASVLTLWVPTRRHRNAVFESVITDLAKAPMIFYHSGFILYPAFDSTPNWMLDGRELELNILDASQARTALMAMTVMADNVPHRLYATAEEGYQMLSVFDSHEVIEWENDRRALRRASRAARIGRRNHWG